MATVRVSRHQAVLGLLPQLCLRCGSPAAMPLASEVHWCPTWLYYCFPLLPLFVLAAGLSQLWHFMSGGVSQEWLGALCCYCQLPLCRQHRRRSEVRKLAFVSCLYMLPFICVVCSLFLELEGVAIGVTALVLWLPWLVVAGWLQASGLRVTEITHTTITLAGVSEAVVAVIGIPSMTINNPRVGKVLHAIHQNFHAVGYSVVESETASVIHLPHLVSFPSFAPEEQRDQVQLLVEMAIKAAGVPGVTFTLKDTDGREAGNPNWLQYYTEIRVPKG